MTGCTRQMTAAPSAARQRGMLERLRAGMVLAGHDQAVLRYLERRRYVRAHPLHDSRTGKPVLARAWQITDAGVAAALQLAMPRGRKRAAAEAQQIDIEDHLVAAKDRP